jgi:hypothetical protein
VIILIGVVLAVVLCRDCQAADATAPGDAKEMKATNEDTAVAWGKEVGGLRGRIWTDKARFNTEEPIMVHYAIQNAAKEPKTVWHSGFWPNHRIDMTGPDGKPAKFKSGEEAKWKAFSPDGTREKNAPLTLKPGEIDDAYIAYNLRDFFDMKAPGTYLVQYLYQETKDEAVQSNELQIAVARAAK